MQEYRVDFGLEEVSLEAVNGRVLQEDILADRPFPPFDRATKDGVALRYQAFKAGVRQFLIKGIQAAGQAQKELKEAEGCLEVMTGAVVPAGADTVVPYEETDIKKETAFVNTSQLRQGQNIHFTASDAMEGEVLLRAPARLRAQHVNTLATVGKSFVQVARLPRVAVISTGNELVEGEETPELHQIRKSNVYALKSLLKEEGIAGDHYHLQDNPEAIGNKLKELLETYDVLLISGGVSKGKYDYVPESLHALGVEKVFHGIKQRPGKPFWFGTKEDKRVFAFPGNPVSTFVCYLLYFRNWLDYSANCPQPVMEIPNAGQNNLKDFWHHRLVEARWSSGKARFELEEVNISGSGDLVGLNKANGILSVPPAGVAQEPRFTPFARSF